MSIAKQIKQVCELNRHDHAVLFQAPLNMGSDFCPLGKTAKGPAGDVPGRVCRTGYNSGTGCTGIRSAMPEDKRLGSGCHTDVSFPYDRYSE